MAHNPILEQRTINRVNRFIVEHNTIGLLYQDQRFIRQIQSGESPSLTERLMPGGIFVYVIDVKPHSWAWHLSLPAKNDKDLFSLKVNLRYHVVDPERMVNEKVADTDLLISDALESRLRHESRQYAFNRYVQLVSALEEAIQIVDLPALCGLQLIGSPDIVVNLTDDDHRRIKALGDIDRAMRVTQSVSHVDELPSSDPTYNFSVKVNVGFKVSKPDDMPSDSLAECEKQLWPRIKRSLQKESRRYGIQDMVKATEAMQEALDGLEGYENFGLKVTLADLTVDLEKAARTHYVELAEKRHAIEIQKVELEEVQATKDFYTNLIRQGDYAVLAIAVGRGEISIDELYQNISQQEREHLNAQIDLLVKVLRSDGASDKAEYSQYETKDSKVDGRSQPSIDERDRDSRAFDSDWTEDSAQGYEALKSLMERFIERSGGIDLNVTGDVGVSGDVVGRDKVNKITVINPPNSSEVERSRRLEALFPAEPVIGNIESLLVQIKIPTAKENPEAKSEVVDLPFRSDARGTPIVSTFKITVIAPDFKIHGPDTKEIRVSPDRDSPVVEFQLESYSSRSSHIQVEIYAESGLVGQLSLPVNPVSILIPVPSPWLRQLTRGVILLDR